MNGRYHGKRFLSLIFVVLLLSLAYYFGDPLSFESYAKALGFIYGVYATGQSATDWRNKSTSYQPDESGTQRRTL